MHTNYDDLPAAARQGMTFSRAPMLDAAGLPPVGDCLPANPLVMESWAEPPTGEGVYGGTLRYGEINPRFCHYMRHINEAPLLDTGDSARYHHYTRVDGPVLPGVLEGYECLDGGRVFVFAIRRGLRWSDGMPVTTRDADYAINDVLLNPRLRRFLTNSETSDIMLPEWEWLFTYGKVRFEALDEQRFSLTFERPFPSFALAQVRSARWQMLLRPRHYLEQYHEDYADPKALSALMAADGIDAWPDFYNRRDPSVHEAGYMLGTRIPEIWRYPTLDPWVFLPESDKRRAVLERNPHYWVVDAQGRQLPYIDRVERTLCRDRDDLAARLDAGEFDIECNFIKLPELARLKALEPRGLRTALMRPWQIQQAVILVNLCPAQEELRPIVQDVRFRQALSLSLDRTSINKRVYLGLGTPSQACAGADKPWYCPEHAQSFAGYDPDRANALLDEMGLAPGPDGVRLTLRLVYYLVTPVADEICAELTRALEAIGIRLEVIRLDHGSQMGAHQAANRHVLGIWEMCGDDPLIPYQVGGMSDPTPLWWKWYETGGIEGVMPNEAGRELYALRDELKQTGDPDRRAQIAGRMFRLQADNLWVIGIAAEAPQPLVYNAQLNGIDEAAARGYFPTTVLRGAARLFFAGKSDI